MSSPQSGIFTEGSAHHYLLEYAVREGANVEAIRSALGGIRVLESDDVARVIAFGARAWARLAPDIRVPELRPLEEVKAGAFSAPSTQRDLLFWLHGARRDALLDQALAIHHALDPIASLELDQPGFVYRDSRDLTGFIDGTANPTGDARLEVACVPDGRPGAGGSFALTQRWIHDLPRFRSLPVEEQERVIGRTRPDSVELEGDAMPIDSHVSRTDLKVDGVAQKLYRRSFPYGTVREHGLCFLAFTCELSRFDVLLRSMFGASGDGIHDRLIEFTRAVTGSYWFAPAEEDLAEIL